MSWVWEFSEAVGNDRLVLLAIADRANDDGADAWPNQEELSSKTRLSRRTVQRCILSLEQLGELVVSREVGNTNRYTIPIPRPVRRGVNPRPPDPGLANGNQRQIDAGSTTTNQRQLDAGYQRQIDAGVKLSPVTDLTPLPASAVAHSTSCTSRSLSPRAREADEPDATGGDSESSRRSPKATRPRVREAWSGRFPVPISLHERFVGLLTGREPDPHAALARFYADTESAFTEGPRGGELVDPDMFVFWPHRFREQWSPSPPAPMMQAPTGTGRQVEGVDVTNALLDELARFRESAQ